MKTFIDCCAFNDLSIEGSFFQHKEIHKVTLPTPAFTSTIKWITSQSQRSGKKTLFDVKVTRGSDVDSDYHRVIEMFEMKLAQEYSDDSRRY